MPKNRFTSPFFGISRDIPLLLQTVYGGFSGTAIRKYLGFCSLREGFMMDPSKIFFDNPSTLQSSRDSEAVGRFAKHINKNNINRRNLI